MTSPLLEDPFQGGHSRLRARCDDEGVPLQLRLALRTLDEYSLLARVRAGDFVPEHHADNKPDKAAAKAVAHACLEHGLMLLTCGPWDNTIRFMPPLVVTEEQVHEALSILELSLKESVK